MRAVLNRLWRARRAVALYAALMILGLVLGQFLHGIAIPEVRPMNEPMLHRLISTALVVFVVAAAIPFVPGAEIGFALLLIFGGQAAPAVYLCMVAALLLSYVVARLVPSSALASALRWLGLRRAAQVVTDTAEADPDARLAQIASRLPDRIGSRLLANRYLLLAVVLNVPGNSLLGGGGGLAFFAGASGIYRFWPYVASVLLAVAPVPLVFALG